MVGSGSVRSRSPWFRAGLRWWLRVGEGLVWVV